MCDAFKSCAYFYHTVNVTANLQCTAEAVASLTENLVSNEKFKRKLHIIAIDTHKYHVEILPILFRWNITITIKAQKGPKALYRG